MGHLIQLFDKYNTDKNSHHSYGPTYEELFESVRFDVKKVLEIGVFQGESLRVWRDYFPHAEIYGFDETLQLFQGDTERINLLIGDQSNALDLLITKDYGPFDIIIDDGSHDPLHQIFSFCYFISRNLVNWFYVIEDIPTEKLETFSFLEIIQCNPDIFDDNLAIWKYLMIT